MSEKVILVVGQSRAGKSTLLNLFLNTEDIEHSNCNPEFEYKWKWEQLQSLNGLENVSLTRMVNLCEDRYNHIKWLDTPGIGDTLGFEQDERNLSMILNEIRNYEKIDNIVFVFSLKDKALSPKTIYMMSGLLQYIPKDKVNDIILVCTNNDEEEDLKHSLKLLEHKYRIKINEDRSLNVDNPMGFLLRKLKNNEQLSSKDKKKI